MPRLPLVLLLAIALLAGCGEPQREGGEQDAGVITQAAAMRATQSLIHESRGASPEACAALAQRAGDGARMATQAFAGDYENLSPAGQLIVASRLETTYLGMMLLRVGKDAAEQGPASSIASEALDDGAQGVSFDVGGRRLMMVWAPTDAGPRIVDFGTQDKLLISMFQAQYARASENAPSASERAKLNPSVFLDILGRQLRGKSSRIVSRQRLQTLLDLALQRLLVHREPWPPYSGARFVLNLVAVGAIDPGDDAQRALLLAPSAALLPKPGAEAYTGLDRSSIATAPVGNLTTFAGRRNADPDTRITPAQEKAGTPLFADTALPDVVLVAYSDGSVRALDRAALGLKPGDPFITGPEAKSPILRLLSIH